MRPAAGLLICRRAPVIARDKPVRPAPRYKTRSAEDNPGLRDAAGRSAKGPPRGWQAPGWIISAGGGQFVVRCAGETPARSSYPPSPERDSLARPVLSIEP